MAYAIVGGGLSNTASNQWSTVGGGRNNTASGFRSAVGGGTYNTASDNYSAIGGGLINTASSVASTVGGGRYNQARGSYSMVAGGGGLTASDSNSAIGIASAIPGGRRNIAAGEFSFAAGLRAQANHDGCFVWADSTDADYTSTADDQFLIRANGGVGIGTNGPAAQLHVTSTGSDYGGAPGVNEVVAGFKQTAGTRHSAIAIDATTNRDAILYLAENGSAKWGLRYDADDADKFQIRWHGAGSNTAYLTIESATGEVGIGTASPSERLHVVGNICYTGSIAACSDARYKTDVTAIPNSLESVMQMRGVRYKWKQEEFPGQDFDDKAHIGFIAQEIETLFPEMVLTDGNGYKSVDYGRLTPVLVEAIKEQQKAIGRLLQRVQQLERAM